MPLSYPYMFRDITFGLPKFSVTHPSGDPRSAPLPIFKLLGPTDHLRWDRHAAMKRQ